MLPDKVSFISLLFLSFPFSEIQISGDMQRTRAQKRNSAASARATTTEARQYSMANKNEQRRAQLRARF
jgi:hypothetical protein